MPNCLHQSSSKRPEYQHQIPYDNFIYYATFLNFYLRCERKKVAKAKNNPKCCHLCDNLIFKWNHRASKSNQFSKKSPNLAFLPHVHKPNIASKTFSRLKQTHTRARLCQSVNTFYNFGSSLSSTRCRQRSAGPSGTGLW